MILSFEFDNHFSYKELQSFSMKRPAGFKYEKESIIFEDEKYSRVAAVYGANASGKSGFVEALKFLCDTAVNEKPHRNPFAFSIGELNRFSTQSNFSLCFVAEGVQYQYDLTVCHNNIVMEENLYAYRSQKPSIVYERSTDLDSKKSKVKFGNHFSSSNVKSMLQSEVNIPMDVSVLSFLGKINEETTRSAYEFLRYNMFFCNNIQSDQIYDLFQNMVIENSEFYTLVRNAVPAFDFGIHDIKIDKPAVEMVNAAMGNASEEERQAFIKRNTRAVFVHEGSKEDRIITIPESTGTEVAMMYLMIFANTLKTGGVCVVDELDSSLHPILVAKMVDLFNNKETNPNNAQLIFTTHDISLIENYPEGEVLDRDQIWFARKNRMGESAIYSLLDIDDPPRSHTNIGRKYINGRYGAIPEISICKVIAEYCKKDQECEHIEKELAESKNYT